MRRALTVVDLIAWIVAGAALACTVIGWGWLALGGLVVFVIVETTIVLDFLGLTPGDLR